MNLRLCWLALLGVAANAANAADPEWVLHRFEGHDYVALQSVATFYGVEAPPRIAPQPLLGPPAPGQAEMHVLPPPPDFTLHGAIGQVQFVVNSREVLVNGVRQWLAFPVRVEQEQTFVSRLDLAKILEPRLRPEKIAGFTPVETIVIDPGHGGHDRGAISKFGFEKDFALDVALRARVLLEANRYKVVMTRSSDIFVPLEGRAAIANRIENAIFVSIHFNSSNTNAAASGFELFSIAPRGAPASNDGPRDRDLVEEPGNASDLPSTALAASIYHALLGHIPVFDRGLKHARFAVLRRCIRPAVLIECGFVSNGPESALIGSPAWRKKLAEAIVDGVDGYKGLAERGQRPRVMADYRRDPIVAPQ